MFWLWRSKFVGPYLFFRAASRSQFSSEAALNGQSVECQPFGAGARPSLAAIVTRSAREAACIFRITLPRCAFTVISLMPSSPPTCLFKRPETTNAMTSRSRGLRNCQEIIESTFERMKI